MENHDAVNELRNFRFAIDEATMVVYIDQYGKITFANKNFCDLTGFKESELCGRRVHDILGKNNLINFDRIAINLNKGASWKGEIFFKGSFNQNIWMHSTIVPLNDEIGKEQHYMAILVDITARKIFEEEIVNSENKYKLVVNSVKEVIFQTDINGEWTFLNQAWTDITGIHILDAIGLNYLTFIHNDDKKIAESAFTSLLDQKNKYLNFVIKIKTIGEKYRTCDFFANIIRDENGKINGFSGTINDITDKKRNEELLQKSYSFQRAILDSAKQAIISTDLNGIIKTVNHGAEEILGFSNEQLIGKYNICALFDPRITKDIKLKNLEINYERDSDWFKKLIIETQTNNSSESEQTLFSSDNNTIPVIISLTAIKDHFGNTSGYLFIANDVSQRKKAEVENLKLNKILEETPDYVIYYDLENKPLYTNKAYKEIRFDDKNFETTQPLHPPWVDIIIRKKAIPYAIEFGSWKGETAILDKDGNEIPVLQLIIIHKDESGVPVFRSSVMRDITQRKQYEHKLLQSEKKNRDLINYSQGVICTHDLKGTILSINPAGSDLIGYTLEELVGFPITEFMENENKEKYKTEYLSSFGSNRVAEGVLALMHKNGTKIQLLYKNYKVSESNGDTYIIGFAQDITERLNAETELKSAKLLAEDSLKAKEMFLANMSHEIRTPMNGIVGLTNLLLKSPLNEKQNQFAFSVKQSAENLLVIINDILDFSKIQAGKLEINKVPFDLGDLLYNLRQTFQLEAQKKGISLITTLDDKVHTHISGDQVRINQILVNLISNAIKFTTHGSVTISIKQVTDKKHATRLKFIVKDTGIGIAEDKIQKVFQSFTQANVDTSRKYGGTGLGLSIVKNLLELMGSSVILKSKIGEGSEFSFELNLNKSDKVTINPNEDNEINLTGKLQNVKILLAEDNKVNQLFANELLTDWGVELDIADNGSIAIDLIKTKSYDLILMDIQMPIMSGTDATNIIRNQFEEPIKSIPIIAMTANAMKGDDDKYINAGMNDVVFKPFESLELYNKICKQITKNKPIELKHPVNPPLNIENIANEEITHDLKFNYASLEVLKSFSRGKISFISKMLNVIVDTVPISVTELEKSILNNKWDEVNKMAHKLIPNMNMMGNAILETEMKWIEDHALQLRNQTKIREKWIEIRPLIDNVLNEIIEARNHYSTLEVTNKID